MPVRKSNGRRRGIQNGVQRHKLRSQPLNEEDWEGTDANPTSEGQSRTGTLRSKNNVWILASHWAEKCFTVTSDLGCALCLVPLVKGDEGCFRVASLWRRCINAMTMTLLAVTCTHKLVATIMAFTIMPVGTIARVLSYAGFLLQMTTMSVGMSLVFMPYLSCELLNGWSPTISQAASRLGLAYRSPWTYPSCSIQVLSTAAASVICVFVFPLLSIVFPTAPIFLFPSLKASGMVSTREDWLAELALQFGCCIFDVCNYGACLILTCFGSSVIFSEIGFQKAFIDLLR